MMQPIKSAVPAHPGGGKSKPAVGAPISVHPIDGACKPLVCSASSVHSGCLILVNGQYPCLQDSSKISLVPVGPGSDRICLERAAAVLLNKLMEELGGWAEIIPVSGWRSEQEQHALYGQSILDNGVAFTEKYVAKPGHSEHQTGLAIDLALRTEALDLIRPAFPDTGLCRRFRQKAAAFGFIERYPKGKETLTGIAHEPWHFRYVGVPHAAVLTAMEMTLEEYHTYLKQFPHPRKHHVCQSGEQIVRISHIGVEKGADAVVAVDDRFPYMLSGNNDDGFILTEWRLSHDAH